MQMCENVEEKHFDIAIKITSHIIKMRYKNFSFELKKYMNFNSCVF